MATVAEALLMAVDHQRAGRAAPAEAIYRGVLDRDPDQPTALRLLGLLHLASGRAPEAARSLARSIAAAPRHTGARLALARAYLETGAAAAALEAASAALAVDPDLAEGHFLRGTALNALGQPGDAAPALERAVGLDPLHAAAHLNLGNAYADLDRLEEAEVFCRAAIRLDPDLAEAQASLGFALTARGRLDAAIAACDAAIRLRPDFAQAHWNRATACLLAGDFAAGFREYEWRKRHDRFRAAYRDLPGPAWTGEALEGRTLLVNAEQGLGDTLQLSRFLPGLAAQGARVVLACDRRLAGLLGTLPGVAEVVPRGEGLPPYDLWVDQMTLPLLLGTSPATIPSASGYLTADPARVAAWRDRLPVGRRIGLAWAGNPAHSNDRRRSLPPDALAQFRAVAGVSFVSLQVGARSGEIGAFADLSADLADFTETAALIAALDLVVTVDTSVAHLAGALGVATWVMLPFAPDWRWILGRDDTPWYKSVRLFRQTAPGDWADVIARVAVALAGNNPVTMAPRLG